MREILFRGKHIHAHKENEHLNGRWVYGYLCDKRHINSPELGGDMLVDQKTIGQYTGLKDKNGKWIFKGDIVKNKQGELRKVEYWPSMCRFVLVTNIGTWDGMEVDYDTDYDTQQLVCSELEVIGNIFDNPELIEEVAK